MPLLRATTPGLRSVRLTAAAVALVFVAGQLAGSYHAMVVRHTQCAEHGELVELHPQGGHLPAADLDRGDRAWLGGDDHSDAEHAHEHCTLAPRRREEAIGCARMDAPARLPAMSSFTCAGQGRIVIVQQALFRLAPKNSPPA